MIQELWLPFILPGMNKIISDSKSSGVYHYKAYVNGVPDEYRGRGRYGENKRKYEDDIIYFAKKLKPVKAAAFQFLWVDNSRRDPDNITAGAKIIFDALVRARVIRNDSKRCIISPLVHLWATVEEARLLGIKEQGVLITMESSDA